MPISGIVRYARYMYTRVANFRLIYLNMYHSNTMHVPCTHQVPSRRCVSVALGILLFFLHKSKSTVQTVNKGLRNDDSWHSRSVLFYFHGDNWDHPAIVSLPKRLRIYNILQKHYYGAKKKPKNFPRCWTRQIGARF